MTENSINILLIEDNPDDVVLLKRKLSSNKFDRFILTVRENLMDGLLLLEQTQFDIILLDLSLPGSTGLETFTSVHSRTSTIPIIVLTGLADEEMAVLAVRLGAQDYLVKDHVDHYLLVRAIQYAIERKKLETRMIQYQKQLRTLASELSLAEERERRRIATELHDHIGQNLAISKIKLGLIREATSSTKFAGPLEEIYKLIDQTIRFTRSLTFELSPPVLYEFGFEAAVEWLAERVQDQYNIQVTIENDQKPKPLNDDVRVLLFQAVRELLINVVKHAQSKRALIRITRHGHNINVLVEDYGKGFDASSTDASAVNPGGFGLFNIRERLKHFGGNVVIDSAPGQGTRITLTVPLKDKDQLNEIDIREESLRPKENSNASFLL
jgi:signal transduction histidine kinase